MKRRSGEEIKQRIIYGLYSGDTTAYKPAVAIETRVKGRNSTDNYLSVGFEPEAVVPCIL